MAREPTCRSADLPYHLSGRANNKEWFYLPLRKVWEIFAEKLSLVSEKYGAEPIAFVLMDNHYHLLLRTPNANLDRIMNYFVREISRSIGRESGRINHVFGGRYHWSLIDNAVYFAHAYKYVYRNPVKAGLSPTVEDYRFSTYPAVLRGFSSEFPVHDFEHRYFCTIPKNHSERTRWLNEPYSCSQEDLIRRALRKHTMGFGTGHDTRALARSLLLSTAHP